MEMFIYEKSLLMGYRSITNLIYGMQDVLSMKALYSYKSFLTCEKQADEMFEIIRVKDKLIFLRRAINNALKGLEESQLNLIKYKYFKIKRLENVMDTQSRTYFRNQLKALQKFKELLVLEGVSYEWFLENQDDLVFIKDIYDYLLEERQIAC